MGCTQTKAINATTPSEPKALEPTVQFDEEQPRSDQLQALNPYLIAEALRVFELADKDHNNQIDLEELANVRNSEDLAKAMMGKWDIDLSGTISKDEWLNYFAKAFKENEEKASIVLKVYEKQIGENKNMHLESSTINPAEPNSEPEPADPIIEDKTVPTKKLWCACR